MHQFFATLFAMLLSLCHHSALSRAPEPSFAYGNARPSPVLSFPDREDLARGATEASYAVSGCLSCTAMNVSYTAR